MRISEVSVMGGQIGSDCRRKWEWNAAGKGDGQEVRNSKKEERMETRTPIRASYMRHREWRWRCVEKDSRIDICLLSSFLNLHHAPQSTERRWRT